VKFSVTIGAHHDAFIQFLLNFFPASRIPFFGYSEFLTRKIIVVEFERIGTAIIAAYLTLTAFIFNGHLTNFFSPGMNGSYKILPSIAILSIIGQPSPPLFTLLALCAEFCTRHFVPRAQPDALPTELQGSVKLSTFKEQNNAQIVAYQADFFKQFKVKEVFRCSAAVWGI